jgi:hypothetical protein
MLFGKKYFVFTTPVVRTNTFKIRFQEADTIGFLKENYCGSNQEKILGAEMCPGSYVRK